MDENKELVLITGGGGFIGQALVKRLAGEYTVVSLDRSEPKEVPSGTHDVQIDLTSDESVHSALLKVREEHGQRVASVIHLAAYLDLTGEPNSMYEEVTDGKGHRTAPAGSTIFPGGPVYFLKHHAGPRAN